MTAPLITDHVYRRQHWTSGRKPGDGCAYAGCGQPAQAHQRRAKGRLAAEREPGRDTPGGAL